MPDLRAALERACEFARAHGVENPITPCDFGIQRSDIGYQRATYVDDSHAVTVTISPDGRTDLAVAELFWIHDQGDDDRDICDCCEVVDPAEFVECYRGVPLVDVYLPGDAPQEVSADA